MFESSATTNMELRTYIINEGLLNYLQVEKVNWNSGEQEWINKKVAVLFGA